MPSPLEVASNQVMVWWHHPRATVRQPLFAAFKPAVPDTRPGRPAGSMFSLVRCVQSNPSPEP